MRLAPVFILFIVATAAGWGSADAANPDTAFTDRWIVTFEDAPTLEFSGSDAALESGPGTTKAFLEATAPALTGRAFDALDPAVLNYEQFLIDRQTDFVALATAVLGRKLKVGGSTQHVANALVLEDLMPEERQLLAGLPNVRSIEKERLLRLQLADGPALIGARTLAEGSGQLPAVRGEGTVVGIIDSGINWDHQAFQDDPAYSDGYVYSNPYPNFLGLCSRANVPCNNKLVGVYDFTTDSTDGEDTDGHGTHVASIAAGNEWRAESAGVAPRAHVVSYRVCTEPDPDDDDAGTCQGGAILQAFDQAVRDGVDVINYSIGGDPFDPWRDSAARRVLNLLDAGIGFATSAGNSGPEPETVGSPAEAPWIFAVGMTTTREWEGKRVTIGGVGTWDILYGTGPDLPPVPIDNASLRAGDQVGGTLEACEAFPPAAFDGAVALLKRGDCFFVDKVSNAAAAGAIAVIMFNNVEGGPIIMGGLEGSAIPAGMVSLDDGEEILSALRAAGGELPVSLPNATLTIFSESLGDQLAAGSSRGPAANVPNVMKPNVVAPGVSIRAAFIGGSTEVARLSGTSMASPHAAGSMALLKQLSPEWTSAMLTSALETTAEADPVRSAGDPTTIFERGAGRIRVDLAARAGLYLPVTRGEFQLANPEFGGNPGELNLSGLVNENCSESCTFTRTVTAMRPGTWSVEVEGEPGIEVSPSDFDLALGQSQELTITVSPAGSGNALEQGSVVLSPASLSSGGLPLSTQRLPIGVRATTGEVDLPGLVRVRAESDKGRKQVDLGFVDDLPEAVFRTSALEVPSVEQFSLPEDPDNSTPYDGSVGTQTFAIDIPEGAMALWAETVSSSAVDVDLFVGRDANRDGIAQSSEENCKSITPDQLERCVIANPAPGSWWVVVQNWESSAAPQDSIRLEYAVLTEAADSSLAAFGPGRHEAGLLSLDVYWDSPSLTREQRSLGVIGVSSRQTEASDVGVVPLAVELENTAGVSTTIMFPGESLELAVPGGGHHDRLVFDVPPTATSLAVNVQGEPDVSGQLRQIPFDTIRDSAPATPGPAGPVLASGSGSIDGFTLATPATPVPGRYFVELENASEMDRVVEVTVSIEEDDVIVPRFGLWSPVGSDANPRQISQGIEWQQAGNGFVLWYSYEPDGLPVFYLGDAPIGEASSVWVAELSRYTIGDGNQIPDPAGKVAITPIGEEEIVFSWRLGGSHGSDIKTNFNAATCPSLEGQEVSYTGTWYTPGANQGGSSAVVTGNAQGHIRYYYDGLGVGRWVLATDGGGAPLVEELELFEFRGFCPGCEPSEVSSEVVGTYFRSYDSEDSGVEALDFISRPPLSEQISLEVPIVKLSSRLECR
jgi:subtilisin family serine protease